MLRRTFFYLPVWGVLVNGQTGDPWSPAELVESEVLAKRLIAEPASLKVFYVGFPVLYRAAHIRGATLAGPCSKPEGLAALKQQAASLPRDGELFLYCGCCPFDKCPNIRPAHGALRAMGFTRLRVVQMATNLHTDWVTKGFPTERT